jgi:hypothetical protein
MKAVRSEWSGVSKSIFGFALCALIFALCFLAEAQPTKKVFRLGILSPSSPVVPTAATAPNLVPKFLSELGYIEGQKFAH